MMWIPRSSRLRAFVVLIFGIISLMNPTTMAPAKASEPEPVTIDLQVTRPGFGTFGSEGAIEDQGMWRFTSFESTASPAVISYHIGMEFTGTHGTFVARLDGSIQVATSCVWDDDGRWVMQSGTGAYEDLKGTGAHHSPFNVCTGETPAVWTGRVHTHG